MTDRKDQKRLFTYAGLALIVAIALAVSLKDRRDAPEPARFSQVVSEFVNLSAAPDPRGLDFLSRDRVQRTNRADRLDHIDPDILAAFATTFGKSEDELRAQITDPSRTGPFDHTRVVFESPKDLQIGQAGPWMYTLIAERAEIRVSETVELAACGQDAACRVWLLYWTDSEWYYAPVGAKALNDAVIQALPEFAEIVSGLGEE